MPFKKYNLLDRGKARLDGAISASDTTFVLENIENLPESNFTLTITHFVGGLLDKSEKVYVTTRTGAVCTGVIRGYAGSTLKSFDDGDGVDLNIIAEHITDIQTEVARLETDKSNVGHTHTFSSLTSKPSTLAGYGILDAYSESETDALLGLKVGTTGSENIGGTKTFTSPVIADNSIIATNGSTIILNNSQTSPVTQWEFLSGYYTTTDGIFSIYDRINSKACLSILRSSGFVGINMVNPQFMLDVNSFPGSGGTSARVGRLYLLDENTGGIPAGLSSETAGFGLGLFSPSGTMKFYIGGKTTNEKKLEITSGKFIYGSEWETEFFYGPRNTLLSSQVDMGYRFRDSTGKELFRIRTAANDVCVGYDMKFRKEYATGGSGNIMTIASRYELSGITHGSQGHKMQVLWGDLNNNAETASSDGGWGFMFGSNDYKFLELINIQGSNRVFAGNHNQNNCFVIRGDANDTNATNLLNAEANKTMIVTHSGNTVVFYWKDHTGSKYKYSIAGSSF